MKTAKDLREVCADVIQDLRNGDIASREAGAIANIAGKMISSATAQLKHSALRDEVPEIDFLKEPGKRPKKRPAKK